MKRLKYVGHYDRQSYTKADFTRHGVSDEAAKQVSWDTGDVKEVDDEVADFLNEHHPGNFVEVDEDDVVVENAPRVSADDKDKLSQVEGAESGSVATNVDDTPTRKGRATSSRSSA